MNISLRESAAWLSILSILAPPAGNNACAAAPAGPAGFTASLQKVEAAVQESGDSPLMRAAESGRAETVRMLLRGGADANWKGADGYTALMRAIAEGRTEIVDLLLRDPSTDVNVRNQHGSTALMVAVRWPLLDENKRVQIVAGLLSRPGAALEACDQHGETALTLAARTGHAEVLNLLLQAGASWERANNMGQTALIVAAQNAAFRVSGADYLGVVQKLLGKGAPVASRDREGHTALFYALHPERDSRDPEKNPPTPNPKVVEALLKAGARL